MADQQQQQQPAPQQQQAPAAQPGAIDPQMQLLINSFAGALANLPVFQPPAPQVAGHAPTVGAQPVIQQLPNNVIKLPTFHGTVPDSSDSKHKIRSSPASVVSTLSRMDAYFETYAHSYPTDDLKLNALISCFPPNSAAQFWYESDLGRSAFRTYDEFKIAFERRFGATAADKAKYRQDFFRIRQNKNEAATLFGTRYLQLLAEMKAIGEPIDSTTQVARYIDGLWPSLRTIVNRIHRGRPNMTLDEVMGEAEMEEKANPAVKPQHVGPSVQGLQHQTGKPPAKNRKQCFYCRALDHLMRDCPEVAKKKANGTWKDQPRKGPGPSA
jgi:Retrotransposon gag protein